MGEVKWVYCRSRERNGRGAQPQASLLQRTQHEVETMRSSGLPTTFSNQPLIVLWRDAATRSLERHLHAAFPAVAVTSSAGRLSPALERAHGGPQPRADANLRHRESNRRLRANSSNSRTFRASGFSLNPMQRFQCRAAVDTRRRRDWPPA